ncbi:hypothetical protein KM043_007386 [Ampulex compressa]|nr:hypothetical protein KM043_007386 [Ampulex compressa]
MASSSLVVGRVRGRSSENILGKEGQRYSRKEYDALTEKGGRRKAAEVEKRAAIGKGRRVNSTIERFGAEGKREVSGRGIRRRSPSERAERSRNGPKGGQTVGAIRKRAVRTGGVLCRG